MIPAGPTEFATNAVFEIVLHIDSSIASYASVQNLIVLQVAQSTSSLQTKVDSCGSSIAEVMC